MSRSGARKDTQTQGDEHIIDSENVAAKKVLLIGRAADNKFYDVLIDEDGHLKVDLIAGDIQIGAVELKDADSTTRADIEADSSKNALFVQSESLATAANQLADGHNVTVDNAAGASAVNIQDGGNIITVDNVGTFAVQSTLQTGTAIAGKMYITDGVEDAAVNASLELQVRDNDANTDLDTIAGDTTSIDGKITACNTGAVTISAALPSGSNNIGDVDIATIAAGDNNIGNVDIASDLALAVGTDNLGAYDQTDKIYNGTTSLTPSFAVIDAASSGNNTLVAAGSNKIRVLAAFLIAAGTVNVRFESGADGTALTGQMNLIANTGFVLPYNPKGWFETASATLLNLELSAAVSVDGSLVYVDTA